MPTVALALLPAPVCSRRRLGRLNDCRGRRLRGRMCCRCERCAGVRLRCWAWRRARPADHAVGGGRNLAVDGVNVPGGSRPAGCPASPRDVDARGTQIPATGGGPSRRLNGMGTAAIADRSTSAACRLLGVRHDNELLRWSRMALGQPGRGASVEVRRSPESVTSGSGAFVSALRLGTASRHLPRPQRGSR